jgi:hypothetical protein
MNGEAEPAAALTKAQKEIQKIIDREDLASVKAEAES